MAFDELKKTQSFVWGNAPFERVQETLREVHENVVGRLRPEPGIRWLDVACGTGGLAELAKRGGADVVGIDFSPVLIETARARAQDAGLEIDYRVGDAEALEFEDADFDVLSSTFGHMFAPDHDASSRELKRVVRAGGRIGLASWTPEGSIGEMFGRLARFQSPPPEGAGSPLDWGREDYVRERLGDAFDLELERHTSTYEAPSFDEYWNLFSTSFGPTKTLLETQPDRAGEIRGELEEYAQGFTDADGRVAHIREYLLVVGTRR